MPAVAVPPPTLTVMVLSSAKVFWLDSCAVTVIVVAEAASLRLSGLTASRTSGAESSFLIVPVPVSVAVTPDGALETARLTVKVSSPSTTASSVVDTVNFLVSFAVPLNESAVVLAV